MSQENVEVVRRMYELLADSWVGGSAPGRRPDTNALFELWDPNVVIEENPGVPGTAVYEGYEGLVQWWTGFFERYDRMGMEPGEFIPVGDRVVVEVHHRLIAKSGTTVERDITHVWTLRSGRVIYLTGYNDRSEALEAVGLSE